MTPIQQASLLLKNHRLSKLLQSYDTIDTINSSLSYKWYSNPNEMILLHNNQQYLHMTRYNNFIYNTWYNNKYTYTMLLDTAISILWHSIQQSQLLIYNNDSASFPMPLCYSWYITILTYLTTNPRHDTRTISMNKATACPLLEDPPRCAHQKRQGGRHATIQDYEFRVIILFFSVLPFMLFDIRLPEDP